MITYRFVTPQKAGIFKWETSATTLIAKNVGAHLVITMPGRAVAGDKAAKIEARITELLDDMMSTLNEEF